MRNTKLRAINKYLAAMAAIVSLGLLMNFFSAASVTAGNNFAVAKTNALLGKIVENRDFFINCEGGDVTDYEESLLCDVSDLGANRIGLLLLEPSGFLKSLVFDRNSGVKIHEDASIPSKNMRNELARSGISISDARLVAKNIAGFSAERVSKTNNGTRKRVTNNKEVPNEVTPQTPPAAPPNTSPAKPGSTEDALIRIREEVARNSAISAMDTDEIVRRFRSELQEGKTPK